MHHRLRPAFPAGTGATAPFIGGFSRVTLNRTKLNGLSGTIPQTLFAMFSALLPSSAVAGLVATVLAGKRKFYSRESMAPGGLGLMVAVAALPWVGWLGFNAGLALTCGGLAGMAITNAHLTTSVSVACWVLCPARLPGGGMVWRHPRAMLTGMFALTEAGGHPQTDRPHHGPARFGG